MDRFDPTPLEVRQMRENTGFGMDACKASLRKQNMAMEVKVLRESARQNISIEHRVCDLLEALVAALHA